MGTYLSRVAAFACVWLALSCHQTTDVDLGGGGDAGFDASDGPEGAGGPGGDPVGDTDDDTGTALTDGGNCAPCPTNSGWPCHCAEDQCDDGSVCGTLYESDTLGACFPLCESDDDCAVDAEFAGCEAVGACVLTDGTDMYCAFTCADTADCPEGTSCDLSLGVGICYAIQP